MEHIYGASRFCSKPFLFVLPIRFSDSYKRLSMFPHIFFFLKKKTPQMSPLPTERHLNLYPRVLVQVYISDQNYKRYFNPKLQNMVAAGNGTPTKPHLRL